MEQERYYFKLANGSAWWNLKSAEKPHPEAVEISKEEWDAHCEELEAQAKGEE